MLELVVGEKTEYEGIDIIRENESVKFGTVEEFFEQTDFDVLYPEKLPEGVEIQHVLMSKGFYDGQNNFTTEYCKIFYHTTSAENCAIVVHTNPDYPNSFINSATIKTETINGFECYMLTLSDRIQCYFIYENNTYEMNAPTYEDVVTIVSGMKKYDK